MTGKMADFFLRMMTNRKVWVVALLVTYLVSRTLLLTALPPFVDEVIRIYWAKQALQGDLMVGLWDGTWLFVKFIALFLMLPLDALLAARLALAVAGVFTVVGCILAGSKLFSEKVGLVAGFLYVLFPYSLFYNRVAVTDGFLTAFGALILLLSIQVVRSQNRAYVFMLACALVAAILAKLTGFLFMVVPLSAVIFLTPRAEWRSAMLRVAPALLSALVLLGLFYWKGHGGMYQFENAAGPDVSWALIRRNVGLASTWFWMLLTPPFAILAGLSLVWLGLRGHKRKDWYLIFVLFSLAMPYVLGAKNWAPRYLSPVILFVSLLTARFLCDIETRVSRHILDLRWRGAGVLRSVLVVGGVLGLAVWPVLLNVSILADPESAHLPRTIHAGFFTSWSSGYGLVGLAEYLKGTATSEPDGINVLRFYYWDHPYHGLELYLPPSDSLAVYTLDPSSPSLAERIGELADTRRTFLVVNPSPDDERRQQLPFTSVDESSELFVNLDRASRVWYCPRPGGESGLEVWELYGAWQQGNRTGVTTE